MFAYLYKDKLSLKTKRNYIKMIEPVIVCDRCGYKTENIFESFYEVGVLINGLVDTKWYCEKCTKEIYTLYSKEEYYKKYNELVERNLEAGGSIIDLYDI